MTNPLASSNPPFAGPEGLWTADPEELAARLFTTVFAGQGAVPLPQKDVADVYASLAGLGGYSLPDVRSGNTQPLGLTVQLAQECILIWERATVATRLSAGANQVAHTITMLRFGPAVLQASDPVAALKARLH
ncbi:hypothetical protein ACEXQD_11365 [Herbiconiux sp. P15]|uniref:hypothetical protein n=1 Tax=Herbiconiux liukaitaii TaxID=3342799 RepID=UPI0035B735DC